MSRGDGLRPARPTEGTAPMGEPRIRFGAMPHKIGLNGPLAILCAAAAWERVQGAPAAREELFRAWAELEGVNPLSAYPYQRVCWERGWLEVGSCRVTDAGWAELNGGDGDGTRRAA